MVKTVAFTAAAIVAAFGSTNAGESVNSSCSIIDFTEQNTQFLLLNNAVDVVSQSTALSTLVKNYDPLVLHDIDLGEFSYFILGQDLTFTPTLDHLNVTGLANTVPEHVNASSSNCVALEIDTSITVDVSLTLDKSTLAATVQADMYGCATGAPDCEDLTITSIEVAGVDGNYSNITDSMLQRFKSATVQTVALDFDSIAESDFSFHGSGPIISALTNALVDFSADEVNKKGDAYDMFTSKINDQLLSVANKYIGSKLMLHFGATCV
ncbi:Serine/threonine protein Kinase [Phytophthora cinnamomi]|uniref:Serine/threonine protein Kinase n=1 Tax=Phytophthora cinnamomi TaxID=4785 RepID=UPI00355A5EA4|nr:Serine/threonine protein Kinase [Phytophthora cinnamomi]